MNRRALLAALMSVLLLVAGCSGSSDDSVATTTAAVEVVASRELQGGGTVSDLLFPSPSLGRDQVVKVYEPPAVEQPDRLPVLYVLHGQNENERQWETIGLFGVADDLIVAGEIAPLLIVAPDIDNSFGVNNVESETVDIPDGPTIHYDGGRYEDFLALDLVELVDSRYPTLADRSARFVGGISMGGYAALHLAFHHPDLFSRVGGHSPALVTDPEFTWLYRPDVAREERDPFLLAEQVDLDGVQVFLDVGEQDEWGFTGPTVELADTLDRSGVLVELLVGPGGHDGTYWRSHLDTYLRFYADGIS